MQFETWTKPLAELPIDCVAVGVHDDGELTPEAKILDLRCREKLSRLLKRGDFGGKPGENWLLTDLEGLRAERVLLIGLGAKGASPKDGLGARHGAAPPWPPSARPPARASPRWRWRCPARAARF